MTVHDDHDEIRNLLARYNHAIDSQQSDKWADMFTEDGVFDLGEVTITGTEELRTFAKGVTGPMRHVVANEVIEIGGDDATVRAYVFVFAGSPPVVRTAGTYSDELRRVDGRWRFTRRTFRADPA